MKIMIPIALGLGLLAGCTDAPVATPFLGHRTTSGSSSGTGSSTGSGTSGTSGTSGSSSTAFPTGVTLSPYTMVLDAPDSTGGPSANFVTSGQLTAAVSMSDGSTTSLVTYSSSATGAVSVSSSGLVTVQPGATPQTVQITAMVSGAPDLVGNAFVSVQANGQLGVTIQ